MIYSLPNSEGVMKKNNELYEVENKEVLIKTYNALKEKVALASPRKHGLRISSGTNLGGFYENPHVRAVTTPKI